MEEQKYCASLKANEYNPLKFYSPLPSKPEECARGCFAGQVIKNKCQAQEITRAFSNS